ncbi:MAG: trigger factor [Oscillospiraceae bacterium]|jgi:trigger factor|nr:trigger factor [Oscillospiraceae bacterium]
MISTVERLSPCKVAIHFEADAESFESATQKAYFEQRGRIRVPGFRPGKAPRPIIERMYGTAIFIQSAVDDLFTDAFANTVLEHQLNVLDSPDITIEQAEKGKPLLFTASVTVFPQATLGDYQSVAIPQPYDSVDDDAVDQEIERVRERNARVSDVDDRPAQDDDIVNIDYAGTINGEAFDGGANAGEELTIGSGQFIPGFEEQIIGMNPGDERDINVTFPEDYSQEDLRGKDAVFHVKLNGITTRELPALDDEFAKDVSEYDTLEEYRASVRRYMEDAAKKNAEDEWHNELLRFLMEGMVTEIPDIMIEREIDRLVENYVRNVFKHSESQVSDYIKRFDNLPGFRDHFRSDAESRIRMLLALEELSERERLAYNEETDADIYNEALELAAEQAGSSVDELKNTLVTNNALREHLHDIVARRKSLRFLRELSLKNLAGGSANVIESEVPETESSETDAAGTAEEAEATKSAEEAADAEAAAGDA